MNLWPREECLMCKRLIAVSPDTGRLRPHNTKMGDNCPYSGERVA